MNEHFKQQGCNDVQQGYDHYDDTESEEVITPEEALFFLDITESPLLPLELPPSTPLSAESTQNISPQVHTDPMFGESDETYVPAENIAPRYPQRWNRAIQKKLYKPDHEAKTKYSINNYVSSHRLIESYAFTVDQLSTIFIPSNVQDTLADLKWRKVMNKEIEAL